MLTRFDAGSLLGDLRADAVDIRVDVYAVGDRLFVGVLHHQVLLEEPKVCADGVAVRPIRKASKYSSTCRHRL